MFYKIGILGATGRMGQEIAALLHAGFTVKGTTLEFADAVASSKKLTSVDGVPVRLLNEEPTEPVHVFIDFSFPAATLEFLKSANTPLVIGTTGFSASEFEKIKEYSKTHPVLYAANMSPGMSLVLGMLKHLSFPESFGFDIHLQETHHTHKKDAPSGTAKEMIAALKASGHSGVQVESVRAGGVKGVHRVSFIAEDEEFSIEHRVFDRRIFARGALLAAHFLAKKDPGLYSMQDVFQDEGVDNE